MPLPTTTNLSDYLTAVGLTPVPSSPTLQTALDLALEEIERISGRNFTAAGSATAEIYDGIGNFGKSAIVEVIDCHDVSTVKLSGETLTLNTDYRLLPLRPRSGYPIEAIEFYTRIPRGNRVIEVTAKAGFEEVPASIYDAILKLATVRIPRSVQDQASSSVAGAVRRQKIGDREQEFSDKAEMIGYAPGKSAETEAMQVAKSFRRIPYA